MIDPVLIRFFVTAFVWGVGGSLIGIVGRVLNRKKEGVHLDQAAAIGFLIGMAFGAFFAIFQNMLDKT